MKAVGRHPRAVEPSSQLVGEQDQRQLGLVVRPHPVVILFGHQVVKVDRRFAVVIASDIDHPRRRAGLEHVQQQVGEQERRQVVDREDGLNAVYGHRSFAQSDASVVDQHVQVRVARLEFLCESAHLGL